jgi:uncharacterized protein YndB with AHSA1/START domain
MTDPGEASAQAADPTRAIVLEHEVEGTPADVWDALTTEEGLRKWFPLDARVEPGLGGRVWLSWGPGCEGDAAIHVWEPMRRFGWTETYGEDESGRPIKVAVDFHIEGRGGTTLVRLVQSGFDASAEWDEMYDALTDGWTYFLFNLAYYFLKHAGKDRKLAWRRIATDLTREVAWDRLVGGALVAAATGPGAGPGAEVELQLDRGRRAEIVSEREGYHFAATLPELDDGILFVELEGSHIGFWLSTYGMDEARVASLQRDLDARIEETLGTA